ncbi:MAG: hypothetical protein ACOC46_02225 [Pirellulales bacterium]
MAQWARDALRHPAWPVAIVLVVAGLWIGSNLSQRYLWQDEAATAELADRMMRFGKPLAYDGRNLITMDVAAPEEAEAFAELIDDPQAAIDYFIQRGDFKPDTTWTGQPWGQFVVCGLSLRVFGHTTAAARLPFVAAGVLTCALLFVFVRRHFNRPLMAVLAAALLLANVYWVLHVRQCRYYALSSLFLLLVFVSYFRWSRGRAWSGLLFVLAVWGWFQCDYGSLWPTLGILLVHGLWTRPAAWRESALVWGAAGLLLLPWTMYYDLLGRTSSPSPGFAFRAVVPLVHANQYLVPFLLVAVLAAVLYQKRATWPREQTEVVWLALAIILATVAWMPIIAPYPYFRYTVNCVPLAAMVLAFAAVRLPGLVRTRGNRSWLETFAPVPLAAVFALSPCLAVPLEIPIPERYLPHERRAILLRPELRYLAAELFGTYPDPNRIVIEYLLPRLRPDDELLCTYEDIPLMFYTGNRVRGGLSCFRLADRGGRAPRFAVLRNKHPLRRFQVNLLNREWLRYDWQHHTVQAPDIRWGNNPDPRTHLAAPPPGIANVMVFERKGARGLSVAQLRALLRDEPDNADAHHHLALLLAREGETREGIAHYREALRLEPDSWKTANNLAWLLATHPNAAYRDARQAVELAQAACELTHHEEPQALDTLAAAYAEASRFDEAVQTAERALEAAIAAGQDAMIGELKDRLRLFQQGKPYHEPSRGVEPTTSERSPPAAVDG